MPLWFTITLVCFLVLGAIATVAMIGKPRTPITHASAIVGALINVALIVGLIIWGV